LVSCPIARCNPATVAFVRGERGPVADASQFQADGSRRGGSHGQFDFPVARRLSHHRCDQHCRGLRVQRRRVGDRRLHLQRGTHARPRRGSDGDAGGNLGKPANRAGRLRPLVELRGRPDKIPARTRQTGRGRAYGHRRQHGGQRRLLHVERRQSHDLGTTHHRRPVQYAVRRRGSDPSILALRGPLLLGHRPGASGRLGCGGPVVRYQFPCPGHRSRYRPSQEPRSGRAESGQQRHDRTVEATGHRRQVQLSARWTGGVDGHRRADRARDRYLSLGRSARHDLPVAARRVSEHVGYRRHRAGLRTRSERPRLRRDC
jgi:hypothetical protein